MSLGILGGGQLARFMLVEGQKHGLQVHAFCQSETDPAFLLHKNNRVGDLNNPEALEKFYAEHDVITFESEFIDVNILRNLPDGHKKTYPNLDAVEMLRDRKSQKALLEQFKLPTNPSVSVTNEAELREILALFKSGLVAKKRTHGYDGYGTFILNSPESVHEFLTAQQNQLDSFILEPFIKFKRELAVMVYRSGSGQTGHLPWVEWQAANSKCWWVKGPVKDSRLQKLIPKLQSFLRKIDYVGVMAFEFFETTKGLMINELAPRVHNSMHHSLDSLRPNQFELHLACVLGRKVPTTVVGEQGGFAMVNLLGKGSGTNWDLSRHQDGMLYWYDKKEIRPGRKMGHVNALGRNPETALKIALKGAKQCQL